MSDLASNFGKAMAGLEALLVSAERELPAPALQHSRQIVGAVLEVHRQGLLGLIESFETTPDGARVLRAAARSAPVASLLALHGVHPDPFDVRVRSAVEEADRAAGKSGYAELLDLAEPHVSVRVRAHDAATCDRVASLVRGSVDARAPEARVSIEREYTQRNLIPVERLAARGAR